MTVPHVIVVSPSGSGGPTLAGITTALGYTPYGTMSGSHAVAGERPGPGEVQPLLQAAYGQDRTVALLRGDRAELEAAFQAAVHALWRVWWTRLGQPVTHVSPVEPVLEHRLARWPAPALYRLLPGRGCWYVCGLDLRRMDADLVRTWTATGQPPIVFHHRDVRDRILSQVHLLSGPADRVGSLPEHLVYRDIVSALPDMDARITLALTDPEFPGMAEARRCQWLLRHPRVCAITHEELVGPDDVRDRALTRLLTTVDHPDHAAALAALAAVSRDEGDHAVGAWREHFTPEHERLLRRFHDDRPHDDRPAFRTCAAGIAVPEQYTR
ncbi:hypothetical protein [Streptomyces sp. SID3343]|uniref:hypothetical protein n=1 Tax=Streptomyces sp. SID3343 TaxID=2690260 RepID=UPI00136D6483|nr:hypothetical protein [Streptomyces sp. SID3343]MYV99969.1 hypothetical protein [Streptomyces sp. SID3343]